MPTNLSFIINNEPRINTGCKFSNLKPLLELQTLSTGGSIRTAKGLRKALRALNRSIILN
jgi:hypothetical protein